MDRTFENVQRDSWFISVCLALLAWSLPTCATALAANYQIKDLGTLGGASSYAAAINTSGQVVGNANIASGAYKAFLYSGSSLQNLGTLTGDLNSQALGVNDSGQIVGYSMSAAGDSRSFLYSGGMMKDIGLLAGYEESQAYGINNSGQVVGAAYTADSSSSRAYLYSGGVLQNLGTLTGGDNSFANGINASGQIVGTSDNASLIYHAFLYSGGVMQDLGLPVGAYSNSFGWGVNDSGQVVGDVLTTSGHDHAFLYSGGVMRDIGALAGNTESQAYAINAGGLVVGTSWTNPAQSDARAFVYGAGTMVDLNSRIAPASGWTLQSADGVNSAGQIVGVGLINGQTHGFLLTPTFTTAGDVNFDGIVNGQDIALIASNWLYSGPAGTGDANRDLIVNGQDIALAAANWLHTAGTGSGFAEAAAVPEPSAALLALLSAVLCAGVARLRRK